MLAVSFCHSLHATTPSLGSTTTKCFNASATGREAQFAICPGLAMGCVPKDGPHPPLNPSSCAHMRGPSASHYRHPFPATMIILMVPKLSQRLHLPWDGPSESMEQKRIGGSLWSDSSASSPKNHHCYSIWSGPDFTTSPSCSHFCGPREGQEIPSSERSKTDASLLKCETRRGARSLRKQGGNTKRMGN